MKVLIKYILECSIYLHAAYVSINKNLLLCTIELTMAMSFISCALNWTKIELADQY